MGGRLAENCPQECPGRVVSVERGRGVAKCDGALIFDFCQAFDCIKKEENR